MGRVFWWSCGGVGAIALIVGIVGLIEYLKLARIVDKQLQLGPYTRTINFFGAPETISTGDEATMEELLASLRRAGYRDAKTDREAWFQHTADSVSIHSAGISSGIVQVRFQKGVVVAISDKNSGRDLAEYTLQPALIGNISNAGRERRVFVHFSDLPAILVNAITSAEDKHFFTHGGYDSLRIVKALYVDTRDGRKAQGASTISMQLARNLYLSPEKRWKRKLTEFLITLHLERALTKKQILEYYCNQVYLGGYGTFSINGFGEAAHAYFNKDVVRLNLGEAALLAGLIQRPSYFNPFRYPDRARDRRNIILKLMHGNRYITDSDFKTASEAPLKIIPGESEVSETQYSMDLVNSEYQNLPEGQESNGFTNVYTTIDLRLQKAAENAVADGMAQVDRLLAKRRKANGNLPRAQAALIALDPHTGEIKAFVGGRDYSVSQSDRVFAKRPPGSVFKPFVYAAALNTALIGGGHVFTTTSTVNDAPTTFNFGNQTYNPGNFRNEFHGTVTFRQALAKSMNVPAVKVGQMVGYDTVVALAKQAGMNEDIRPTPAVALGAYEVTPFEIARAYTAFANDGVMMQPAAIGSIGDRNGTVLFQKSEASRRVLDPRVNFLLVDMMQDVLKYGTGAGVRSRGFTLPAAGKTGTSHDGWFAGFTSQLLCVVWVGFDDYTELGIEGARSALPIWTQFMLQAAHSRHYKDAKPFAQPPGLVRAAVDPSTGRRPTSFCPWVETDYFIDGTQPRELCLVHQDQAVPTLPNQTGDSTPALSAIIPTAVPNPP